MSLNEYKMSTKITFAPGTKPENDGPIKKAKQIKRNLQKREAYNGVNWYYRHYGDVQGPYDASTMRLWHEGDWFSSTLDIRMGDEGEFSDLDNHFPDIRDAFCVPSQLCILLLSDGETTLHIAKGSERTAFKIDEFVEKFMYEVYNPVSKVWIGEYYVGTLDEVHDIIFQWKLTTI